MTYLIMVLGFACFAAYNAAVFAVIHSYCRGNKQPEGTRQMRVHARYLRFVDGMTETQIKMVWVGFAFVMFLATVFWPLTAAYIFWKNI